MPEKVKDKHCIR